MTSLRPGQTLLHFTIEAKIGKGGMGEVYKARDLKLGRTVAIKVLPAGTSIESKARKRFLQEARSASALNHPNIVTIHSIENQNGIDFIVMEYVEGKKLNSVIAEQPMPVPQLLDLALQTAEALAAAHAAGIVHRDIKAENILLTQRGLIKVLDFGLAKTLVITNAEAETIEQITEAGQMLGTIHYMSPEQARGESVDARSDVFSFGSLLYLCATGKLPFQGGTVPGILYQISNVDPPPASSYRKDLPPDFDSVLKRALAKTPNARFANGEELASELRRIKERIASPAVPLVAAKETLSTKRLVGREQQNRELEGSLEKTLQGNGSIALISGEAGIGKSSLAEEFLHFTKIRLPQVVIGRGRCVEQYGIAQAYLPFCEAIGGLLSGPDGDRLITALRLHAPTWHAQFPAAFESTGAIEQSRSESIGANKERMLRELVNALFHFTVSSPLILLLEDLHWADPSSVDLLRYLSQALAAQRLMIVGTLRGEEVEMTNAPLKAALLEMRSHHLIVEIPLSLLSENDVGKMLDSWFAGNQFSQDLARVIYAKSEGHPLFVTSLLQFLVSERVIAKENDTWTLNRQPSEIKLEVPESVSSMIHKKLEAFNEEDRKIVQYASVEGAEFSSTVLADVLSFDEILLEERLKRIEERHGIVRAAGEEELPDGSVATVYRFVHALYQNALYAELVPKRRIQLHRAIGDSLLKHHSSRAQEIAYRLGEHFRLGRYFEKAYEYLRIAADQAAAIYAHKEAADLYEKAIEQVEQFLAKDDAEWQIRAAELHEKLGVVCALTAQHKRAREEFEKAMRLTPESNIIFCARMHRRIAKTLENERNFVDALKEYQIAKDTLDREIERTSQWWEERLQNDLDRIWFHYTRNEIPELEALTSEIEPQLEERGNAAQRARFFFGSLLAAWRRDRYWVEERHIEKALRFVEAAHESGNLNEYASSKFALGFGFLWKGETEKGFELINESLHLAQTIGDFIIECRAWTYLAVAQRKRKDVNATREYDAKALEFVSRANMQEYIAVIYANEAWLAALEEKWQETIDKAQAAFQIWNSLPLAYPFYGLALWPLIDAELKQNRVEEAIEHARFLLNPSQQKLSEVITRGLEKAVSNSDASGLKAVLDQARAENHL